MFVDIFLKNRSIDFDQNHSKCKTKHQNFFDGKNQGFWDSFSRNLMICL